MRLFAHEPISLPLVDLSRGVQDALRPQRDLLVTGCAREAGTFLNELLPNSKSARVRLHEQ
jgi:hypothetical protein